MCNFELLLFPCQQQCFGSDDLKKKKKNYYVKMSHE